MAVLVLIVIGLWALFCTVFVLLVRGGSAKRTPKPVYTSGQIQWFKAEAKVAHRRHA